MLSTIPALPDSVRQALWPEAARDLVVWLDRHLLRSESAQVLVSALMARQKVNVLMLEHISNLLLADEPTLTRRPDGKLAYLGVEMTEVAVSQVLGAQEFGAPSFAVQRLAALNLKVTYREWSISQLLEALEAKTPVLAFVRTAFLDHWTQDVAHAIGHDHATATVSMRVISMYEALFCVNGLMLGTGLKNAVPVASPTSS